MSLAEQRVVNKVATAKVGVELFVSPSGSLNKSDILEELGDVFEAAARALQSLVDRLPLHGFHKAR